MEIHDTNLKPEEDIKQALSPPHESLFLVLAYLPLFELLVMSKVCKSFKDAVKHDVLLWLNIKVDRPLNSRISDQILDEICLRANGRLQSLVLLNCFKITDDGLLRVIQRNLLIQKLYLTGCINLTPEGVISAVQILTRHSHKLKSLKINGICDIKQEHLQKLHSCLNTNHTQRQQSYYHLRNNSEQTETCFSIDVEECPKCNDVRLIFDCPREACKIRNEHLMSQCRGCIYCVPRCEECGVCVEFEELGDAICAEALCLNCWFRLPKCNFCNKPYCSQHTSLQCPSADSIGFVCGICQDKYC